MNRTDSKPEINCCILGPLYRLAKKESPQAMLKVTYESASK